MLQMYWQIQKHNATECKKFWSWYLEEKHDIFMMKFKYSEKAKKFWKIIPFYFHVKVNVVEEACAICFAVHTSNFEILQQKHQNAKSIG